MLLTLSGNIVTAGRDGAHADLSAIFVAGIGLCEPVIDATFTCVPSWLGVVMEKLRLEEMIHDTQTSCSASRNERIWSWSAPCRCASVC
jgi:hypothetical protein